MIPTPPHADVQPAAPSVLDYARAYVAAGYSVIPIAADGQKRPAFDRLPERTDPGRPDRVSRIWQPYQIEIADPDTLRAWYADGRAGIAVVGGAVSGGLSCLDVESTADAERLRALLEEWRPGLWDRLPRVRTPGGHSTDGGLHLYFRFAEPGQVPNTTLARRPRPGKSPAGIVEMRCEGKYWLAPGGPPECHPLRKPYVWDRTSPKLTQAPTLTAAELDALVGAARSLDEVAGDTPPAAASKPSPAADGPTPLDDYDARGPAWGDAELLGGLGWREIGPGRWRPPGKENPGWSATTTSRDAERQVELLHVFSTNASPFAQGGTYGKGRAFAVIHHKGDLSAAAKALAQRGYGSWGAGEPVRFGTPGGAGSGPKPDPAAPAEPEPWQPPLPLDQLSEPVPQFPLDVYPRWMQSILQGIAAAIPCPVDYPAGFALGVASGMIGASAALRIKGQWREVPSIYFCAIGRPGSGKSPALKAIMDPAFRMHREALDRNEKPVYVSNITTEKLGAILKDQHRGLLLCRDELTAWMNSLDQYKAKGSGDDRQFYLSAWSGDPINTLRKNPDSPPVFVPHPCLTVIGGTQPDVVAAFRGRDDGFSDRILFSYPEPVHATEERWTVPAQSDLDAWDGVVRSLYRMPMHSDNDPARPSRPWFFELDASGRKEWEQFYKWAVEQQADRETPDYLIEPIQKLTNYVPRFALVLHILSHVAPGSDGTMAPRDLPPVNGEAVWSASRLARYFLSHAARAYGAMRSTPELRRCRKVLRWLFDKKVRTFTVRDLHRALHRTVDSIEDWRDPLRLLVKLGYLRYVGELKVWTGRPTSVTYEVNPSLTPSTDETEGE